MVHQLCVARANAVVPRSVDGSMLVALRVRAARRWRAGRSRLRTLHGAHGRMDACRGVGRQSYGLRPFLSWPQTKLGRVESCDASSTEPFNRSRCALPVASGPRTESGPSTDQHRTRNQVEPCARGGACATVATTRTHGQAPRGRREAHVCRGPPARSASARGRAPCADGPRRGAAQSPRGPDAPAPSAPGRRAQPQRFARASPVYLPCPLFCAARSGRSSLPGRRMCSYQRW